MQSATPIVRGLVITWVAVWLLTALTRLTGEAGLIHLLELDFARLFAGDLTALPGVVGYAIAHAPFPELLHLFLNGYLMWLFAPEVETLYPGKRFVRFLVFATLVGAGVHLVLFVLAGGPFRYPVVGGSGLVMAAMAVNAAVYPGRILNLILFRCRMITFFLVLLVLDVLGFLYGLFGQSRGIAVDVHLAGAAFGWIWAGGFQRFDNPLQRFVDRRKAAREQSRQRREQADDAELDRILEKISREGMPSLTKSEKAFLARRSQDRS